MTARRRGEYGPPVRRSRSGSFALVVSTACLLTAGAPAEAQPEREQAIERARLEGEQAIRKAEQLEKRGKTREAKVEWEQASLALRAALGADAGSPNGATAPSAGDAAAIRRAELQWQLAIAEEGRGELVAAAELLRALGGSPYARPELAARRAAVEAKLGQLVVVTTPERVTLLGGTGLLAVTPLAAPLYLLPGAHVLSLEAPGFVASSLAFEVAAGQRLERKVALAPIPRPPLPSVPSGASPQPGAPPSPGAAGVVAPGARSAPLAESPRRTSPLVWAGVATTGALLLAGTGSGVMALRRHGELDDELRADRRADLADSGERWALASDLCFGASLAVAAGTLYYYLRVDRPRAHGAAPRALSVAPWANVETAGIAVSGAL